MSLAPAEQQAAQTLVRLALAEDLGPAGDRTSAALIPAEQTGTADLVARVPGVLAGLPVVALVCAAVDYRLTLTPSLADGAAVEPGQPLARLHGPLRALLAAERTALNFLQRLSGIATLTRRYVEAVAGLPVQILDTRKTTPGWRLLEKYAVRQGGGTNHRLGLYDGVLIKDNHLAAVAADLAAPSASEPAVLQQAIARARQYAPGLPVEIEVDTLDQLEHALACQPEIVLLDNMSPEQLRQAVARRNALAPQTLLEASGGITLANLRRVAETGIDRISIGALTHSATALDIGLDYAT